ncbi:MAG TPA: M20/M25/M40 family metallo-hydrolase [Gemmatimonadales bacterium]|nr:M20/M25/M40 family metallo-hydrolase [Gemmatimonadales bacterium]
MRRSPCITPLAALVALMLVIPDPLGAQQPNGLAAAHNYRDAHAAEIVRGYAELLGIPNVAGDSAGIARNAAYIRDHLRALGVAAELLTLPGASPVVLGRLAVPGATRTVALYAHYDGQPADSSAWTNGPWTPTLYTRAIDAGGVRRALPATGDAVDPEWRLYARSAGDDKAPITGLLTVLAAFRAAHVTPTTNVVFFFEGEEEAGSPHLAQYFEAYGDRLQGIDYWIFLDGPMHPSGRPTLDFGVRGVTGLAITVYGAVRPLHSGHYGNWAPVPGDMLAHLLASMKNDSGRVLIDGFYDSDAPLGAAERAALAKLPDFDASLERELGLARTEGAPATLAERLTLPSLTVRGLKSGNVGPLARNVIPPTAEAVLGIRLVQGNDPVHMQALVEAHIVRQGYHLVRDDPDMATRLRYPRIAKVVRFGGYPAARTSMDEPFVPGLVSAIRQASGVEPLIFPTLGGSLPLYLFTDRLHEPAVIVPVANYDDNQHGADENLRVGNLWYAVDLFAALLTMPDGAGR